MELDFWCIAMYVTSGARPPHTSVVIFVCVCVLDLAAGAWPWGPVIINP